MEFKGFTMIKYAKNVTITGFELIRFGKNLIMTKVKKDFLSALMR